MYKIYRDLILKYKNKFIKNRYVSGMMVIGSVARGTASKISDLDILILRNKERKKTFREFCDNGVLIETHNLTYGQLIDKLASGKKSYYAIFEGIIVFSKDNSLEKVKKYSESKLEKYKYTKKEKRKLKRYLEIVKIKVSAALFKDDEIQASFILTVNFWKMIEGIFLVNNRPAPPNGSALFYLYKLQKKPTVKNIKFFLVDSIKNRINYGMNLIDWILEHIE